MKVDLNLNYISYINIVSMLLVECMLPPWARIQTD